MIQGVERWGRRLLLGGSDCMDTFTNQKRLMNPSFGLEVLSLQCGEEVRKMSNQKRKRFEEAIISSTMGDSSVSGPFEYAAG